MNGEPEPCDTGEFLAIPAPIPPDRVGVEIAARSDPGKVRTNNEDHYLFGEVRRSMAVLGTNLPPDEMPALPDLWGYTLVLADGMGGMSSGEVASRLAIASGLELVRDAMSWDLRLDNPGASESLKERFREYFRGVNRRVYLKAVADPSKAGMGTTLTVAYSVGDDLFVAHAGDSRAYLLQGGRLEQLTHDHTLAQDMLRSGQIRPEELRNHRFRSVLTNYIGSPDDDVNAELVQRKLADGDRLLLCSDGLTDMVEDDQIQRALGRDTPVSAICDELVGLALDAGGRDNVTVLVARYRIEERTDPGENGA